MALFALSHPESLSILRIFPTCDIITSCTSIRYSRVLTQIFLHGLSKISISTIDAFQRNSSETISKKFGLNQLPCFPSR